MPHAHVLARTQDRCFMENKRDFKLLATGTEFLKHGITSTETEVSKLFDDADEIHMLVYAFGHDLNLLKPLEHLASIGKRIVIVVNDLYNEQPEHVRNFLINLNKETRVTISNFKRIYFCDKCDRRISGSEEKDKHEKETDHAVRDRGFLHAKAIVKNRNEMVTGSSNFSTFGMQNHYEMGFYVRGVECNTVASMIEDLAHNKELTEII